MHCRTSLCVPAICAALGVSSASLNARAEDGNELRHLLWMQGLYVPRPFIPTGDGNASWLFSGGDHIGMAGGYSYRLADYFALGLGASLRGFPGGDGYHSASMLSVPLLFTFDPHVARQVRLVMTAGVGALHCWGNSTYMGNAWQATGVEGSFDLGTAFQVSSSLELMASVGARVGKAEDERFFWAAPIGLGMRLSFGS